MWMKSVKYFWESKNLIEKTHSFLLFLFFSFLVFYPSDPNFLFYPHQQTVGGFKAQVDKAPPARVWHVCAPRAPDICVWKCREKFSCWELKMISPISIFIQAENFVRTEKTAKKSKKRQKNKLQSAMAPPSAARHASTSRSNNFKSKFYWKRIHARHCAGAARRLAETARQHSE